MPTIPNTTIVARLSKLGDRVLCGRRFANGQPCGGDLALVICGKGGGIHALQAVISRSGRKTGVPRPAPKHDDWLTPFGGDHEHDRCHIVFRSGWKPDDDGVWTLTNHAQHRVDRDHWLASGNPGVRAEGAAAAQHRLRSGTSAAFHRVPDDVPSGAANDQHVRFRAELPTATRCPKCTGVNRLPVDLRDDAIARFRLSKEAQ